MKTWRNVGRWTLYLTKKVKVETGQTIELEDDFTSDMFERAKANTHIVPADVTMEQLGKMLFVTKVQVAVGESQ